MSGQRKNYPGQQIVNRILAVPWGELIFAFHRLICV